MTTDFTMQNQLKKTDRWPRWLSRLARRVKCLVFGHPEGGVIITKQEGYYQWGACPRCHENVERDGHIWSADKWRKSSVPSGSEYALMCDFSKPVTSACELMMHGPIRSRPIDRAEYDFWQMHCLPRHHSIIGVPQSWRHQPNT